MPISDQNFLKATEEFDRRVSELIDRRVPEIIDERVPKIIEEMVPRIIDERVPRIFDERVAKIIEEQIVPLELRMTRVELILENEIRPQLRILAENQLELSRKMDEMLSILKGMVERQELFDMQLRDHDRRLWGHEKKLNELSTAVGLN